MHAQESKPDSRFSYGASATLQTNYLWRGLFAGATSLHLDANIGYAGLYADMWWSLGATDWRFDTFQPEVDITIGYTRWGVDAHVLYIHNFNCGFFDFANYADKGNRLEVALSYTVSDKIPLRILWATRVSAADGYINAQGNLVRAYSSYAEISYTQSLPFDMSLYGAVGISPWRSLYSGYQRNFSVANIELRLRKDWSLNDHLGLMLLGHLMINPSALANDITTAEWHPYQPGRQSINANIGLGIFLK